MSIFSTRYFPSAEFHIFAPATHMLVDSFIKYWAHVLLSAFKSPSPTPCSAYLHDLLPSLPTIYRVVTCWAAVHAAVTLICLRAISATSYAFCQRPRASRHFERGHAFTHAYFIAIISAAASRALARDRMPHIHWCTHTSRRGTHFADIFYENYICFSPRHICFAFRRISSHWGFTLISPRWLAHEHSCFKDALVNNALHLQIPHSFK